MTIFLNLEDLVLQSGDSLFAVIFYKLTLGESFGSYGFFTYFILRNERKMMGEIDKEASTWLDSTVFKKSRCHGCILAAMATFPMIKLGMLYLKHLKRAPRRQLTVCVVRCLEVEYKTLNKAR